mmetsp:Transcript_19244/g.48165  ORF Transcript_19244/g.48165 Transcript_19244/m.48165 type:complete len:213 (-) Transcript_19244:69-707(-)
MQERRVGIAPRSRRPGRARRRPAPMPVLRRLHLALHRWLQCRLRWLGRPPGLGISRNRGPWGGERLGSGEIQWCSPRQCVLLYNFSVGLEAKTEMDVAMKGRDSRPAGMFAPRARLCGEVCDPPKRGIVSEKGSRCEPSAAEGMTGPRPRSSEPDSRLGTSHRRECAFRKKTTSKQCASNRIPQYVAVSQLPFCRRFSASVNKKMRVRYFTV